MIQRFLIALSLLALAVPAGATETSWRDATAKLHGCWSGTGLGGDVSECWLVHPDGRADGLFLLRKDGAPGFAEILTIDDFGDGPEMRLKHVNGDMTGWEEKDEFVTFKLMSTSGSDLTFKGLVLKFPTDQTLRTELKMRKSDGTIETVPFDFTRKGTIIPSDLETDK